MRRTALHEALIESGTRELALKRASEEIHNTLVWLSLFAYEHNLPEEVAEELRSRLEHIETHLVH